MSKIESSFSMVNWLITRKCNLKCDFCNIVKDYENKPYQPVNEINSLPIEENIKIANKILSINPNAFFIIYGGEPTLYKDLDKLIDHLNEKKAHYTLISNVSTQKIRNIILNLLEHHNLKGLSFSLDPLVFNKNLKNNDYDRYIKSTEAWDIIEKYKKLYPECDIVAETVVDVNNVKYLDKFCQYLTKRNIKISLTTLEYAKNGYYDFASKMKEEDNMIYPKTKEWKILEDVTKNKNYNIMVRPIFNRLLKFLPMGWKCKQDGHNITIDANGYIRLCLRIHGFTGLNIRNFLNCDNEETKRIIKENLLKNYTKYCKGCAWTCSVMSYLIKNEGEKFIKEVFG